MSRTSSVAPEPTATTPETKRELATLCPLKRQHSTDYQADDEDSERSPSLQPRKLDLEQHVSFGAEEEDKYVEKSSKGGDNGEEDEEETAPTQKYEPPEEEEGEIQPPTERTLSCAAVSA